MRFSSIALAAAAYTTIHASAVHDVVAQGQHPSLSVCSCPSQEGRACEYIRDMDSPVVTMSNSTSLIVTAHEADATPEDGKAAGTSPQQMQGSIVGLLGFCIVSLIML